MGKAKKRADARKAYEDAAAAGAKSLGINYKYGSGGLGNYS